MSKRDKFLTVLDRPLDLPDANPAPDECTAPTDVIDSMHPDIIARANQLRADLASQFEQAQAIFTFVRDEIRYNFTPILLTRDDWRASNTMARGDGFCQQKAVLLAALARAAGIPSAIGFQHLRDYKLLETRYEEALPEGIIPYHGLTYLWLDGGWRIADATLDADLCSRRDYHLVELQRGHHARLPQTDRRGAPHFDILQEFGPYADLPATITFHEIEMRPAWEELTRVAQQTGATM